MILATSAAALPVKDILTVGRAHGLRDIEKWNVSRVLTRLPRGLVARTPEGWTLTTSGRRRAGELAGNKEPRIEDTAHSLREEAKKLKSDPRAYVEEAIVCFEVKAYRAAIVFMWAGAVAVLQEHLVSEATRLAAFNTEATRRTGVWIAA